MGNRKPRDVKNLKISSVFYNKSDRKIVKWCQLQEKSIKEILE